MLPMRHEPKRSNVQRPRKFLSHAVSESSNWHPAHNNIFLLSDFMACFFAFDSPNIRGAREESSMTLTKRQKEVLDFLGAFHNKHGYSPSFEEMARSLKLTSLATVHKHVTTLERKGYIRRGYNQSRSIEVLQLPKQVREQVLER